MMNAKRLMPSIRLMALLILILGSLSGRLLAQSTTLTYGDSVNGTLLRSEISKEYTFYAEAGDTVSITATAADKHILTSLFLLLTDPFSNDILLQQAPVGRNAAILNYYLPATGTYTINVGDFRDRGDFTINLALVSHAADREILFEDHFTDNKSDWETGGDEVISANIRDGKYIIDANCQDQHLTWYGAPGFSNAKAVPALDFDYVFEVDVTFTKGKGSALVGLLYDVKQPGYEAANILNYYGSGTWVYRVFDPDQKAFVEISRDQGASVDITDGKTHRLGMSITESEVRFWIDEQQIARLHRENAVAGTIGLHAGCGSETTMDVIHAEFDNVRVTLSPSTFTRPGDTTA